MYKGYSLFNELEDKALQAWNRTAAMFNIASDISPKESAKYAEQIDEEGRVRMRDTLQLIKKEGYSSVRKSLNV